MGSKKKAPSRKAKKLSKKSSTKKKVSRKKAAAPKTVNAARKLQEDETARLRADKDAKRKERMREKALTRRRTAPPVLEVPTYEDDDEEVGLFSQGGFGTFEEEDAGTDAGDYSYITALRNQMSGELGDILWYVASLAYILNMDLGKT